jgi:hypothetical protein
VTSVDQRKHGELRQRLRALRLLLLNDNWELLGRLRMVSLAAA